MVRTRTGWLAAFVVLGLGVGACDSGKGSGTAAGGALSGDVAMLPADSELVLGLNFSQLQQSGLWKQFAPAIMSRASDRLGEIKAACGFDPVESMKSLTLGLKGFGRGAPEGAAVVHGFDKAKLTACMPKLKEEIAKRGGEITEDGDVWLVKGKHGSGAVTFTSGDTLVASFGPSGSKATLQAAIKGPGLGASGAFVDIYKKINTRDSVWALVNGNASFVANAADLLGMKPKAIFGSINVTDGLALDMRVRVANGDEASKVVKLGQQQMGNAQVKAMFDKLDIAAEGSDVHMSVAMSQQKLTAMMGLFGGALTQMLGGGMGGGMGGGAMGGGTP